MLSPSVQVYGLARETRIRSYDDILEEKEMTWMVTTAKKYLSDTCNALLRPYQNASPFRKRLVDDQRRTSRVTTILQIIPIISFTALMTLFFATMFSSEAAVYIGNRLGLKQKSEIITFLGIGMGGVLVAVQALMAYKRSKAMEDVVDAHARANRNTELGQRQERLKNAIEHLGHGSDSVRLGGAYELFHLAQDNVELRETVFEILCSHIRGTTRKVGYQQSSKATPSEEIQSLMNLLFVKPHDVFENLMADLQGSHLNGVDLTRARLSGALLSKTRLHGASLSDANLVGAFLADAQLQGAYMVRAQLQGAFLFNAQLQDANLGKSQMQGANLCEVRFQGANLAWAQMQGTNLIGVQMQGVNFLETDMRGAVPRDLEHLKVKRIVQMIGVESDLSSVTFHGGLNADTIQSLVIGLSDSEATQLKNRLSSEIDREPSSRPPENVITGAYSKEEVSGWMAGYQF